MPLSSPPWPQDSTNWSGRTCSLWRSLPKISPHLPSSSHSSGVSQMLRESPVLPFGAGLLLDIHCLPAFEGCGSPAGGWRWPHWARCCCSPLGMPSLGASSTANMQNAKCLLSSPLRTTWILVVCERCGDVFLSNCVVLRTYAPELSCWHPALSKADAATRIFLFPVILSVVSLSHRHEVKETSTWCLHFPATPHMSSVTSRFLENHWHHAQPGLVLLTSGIVY